MTLNVSNLFNLSSRTVLITGAGGHLGLVIADVIAQLGADLILVDLPVINMDEISNELRDKHGVAVNCYSCDLESEFDRLNLLESIHKNYKNIDVLINNAAFVGTSDLSGWAVNFGSQSLETWRRALEVNLTAPFHLVQGLTDLLREGSSIINISSIYGSHGPDWSLYEGSAMGNPAAYGVSKGGVNQLTRWLATTLAPNVRVNAIAPGGIARNQSELFVKKYISKTPMARMASEYDMAGAIIFLATDMSKYCTGQILEVSGGWGVW